jgi:TolA-binding protein
VKGLVRIILFISLVTFGASHSYAGRIDRAYAALQVHDYFKAKKLFTKAMKYNQTAASQGLAVIYYRENNPFHNYDSAYSYIQLSIEGWYMEKQRKKDKWAKFGFTEDSLYALRQHVSSQFFSIAKAEHTEASYSLFIRDHSWAKEIDVATATRDSIAFFNAVQVNDSKSYQSFFQKYPESSYAGLARQNYYDSQFNEMTSDGSLESYVSYIDSNPTSPLKQSAEKNVFEIVTQENASANFEEFIQVYPENSFVDTAWVQWYENKLSDYSLETMEVFMNMSASPIKERVASDILLYDSVMLPCMRDGAYGFMNTEGISIIPSVYEFAGFFQEGLAVVVKNGKYGFINKRGELQIPCVFESASDFNDGRAIVERNEKVGMIDRNGRFLFDCIYDDLGVYSEGLVYAQIADKYGYYDEKHQLIVPHVFDDAYDFKNGSAKVMKEDKQSYINTAGEFEVPLLYEELELFHDTLYTFLEDGYYGVINHKAQIFVEPIYSSISPVRNGLSVASIEDRLVYLDTLGQMIIDNNYKTYPNFQLKAEFNKGVSIVLKDESYGRINEKDELITDFEYENIGLGKDYFPAEKDGMWGVFSSKGSMLVEPKYDALEITSSGNFVANINDTVGVIDPNGNIVISFAFNEIELLKDNLFLVRVNNSYGVYKNSQLIVSPQFDQIGVFDQDFLFLNKAGVLMYYDIRENKLVQLKD